MQASSVVALLLVHCCCWPRQEAGPARPVAANQLAPPAPDHPPPQYLTHPHPRVQLLLEKGGQLRGCSGGLQSAAGAGASDRADLQQQGVLLCLIGAVPRGGTGLHGGAQGGEGWVEGGWKDGRVLSSNQMYLHPPWAASLCSLWHISLLRTLPSRELAFPALYCR